MKIINKYLFIVLILCIVPLHAQDSWDLVKENDGVKVYTRTNEVMSFKEFKATMTVKAKVEDFVAVLFDVDGLTSWGHNISEAKLLDRPNDTIQIYYAVAKAPWPYKDRDGIYKNTFNWDKKNRSLTVEIELLEDERELSKSYVRMDGYGFWRVTEISANQLKIDFQMQVDPGGSIKAWLANMFVTDSPYQTMTGIREAMSLEKYQGESFEFLIK
ncbi:START domain-containing protein [Lutimonas halocynthiae]|uniref:START domain-containing protein n=1 Tax=Lutimonas halocynthiae TaxID=1446477 RepID=UPI0025B5FFFB|nr:START domain-containing protein [Lutimonas halocynthiae]MDN3642811.1 START domain-containing protein [Lutimonas halocynthiae]